VGYGLEFEDFSLSDLQIILTRLGSSPDAFVVSGQVWLRWGCVRKKVEVKNITFEQLINIISNFAA
jgi:hypothetical protein